MEASTQAQPAPKRDHSKVTAADIEYLHDRIDKLTNLVAEAKRLSAESVRLLGQQSKDISQLRDKVNALQMSVNRAPSQPTQPKNLSW